MEADSGVVRGRVVELLVVCVTLTPGQFDVNREVIFRSFVVGVVVNVFV